jgi:hypothetical protein
MASTINSSCGVSIWLWTVFGRQLGESHCFNLEMHRTIVALHRILGEAKAANLGRSLCKHGIRANEALAKLVAGVEGRGSSRAVTRMHTIYKDRTHRVSSPRPYTY